MHSPSNHRGFGHRPANRSVIPLQIAAGMIPSGTGQMAIDIGRREVVAALGGAAFAWPLVARAQQPAKLPTIGFLGVASPSRWSSWTSAFVKRLHELGWLEGQTVAIEYRDRKST